nr:hypothetical protein Iba_chr11bCG6070 [Ipomoea batatas]
MLTSNDMSTSRTSATLVSGAVRAKHLREKPILSSGITIHIFAELIIAVNLQQNTGTSSLVVSACILLQTFFPSPCIFFHFTHFRQPESPCKKMRQPFALHFCGVQYSGLSEYPRMASCDATFCNFAVEICRQNCEFARRYLLEESMIRNHVELL